MVNRAPPTTSLFDLVVRLGVFVVSAGCSELVIRGADPSLPEAVVVTETFVQTAQTRLDLLLVVDDTPSMTTVREVLAQSSDDLLDALAESEIAWQVGVTATDITTEARGELFGDPWILTPATPDGATALARALAVPDGRAPSGGLGAATLALTEPLRSTANAGFRRPDAALLVVVLSDSDDMSSGVLGVDPADAFLGLLQDQADEHGHAARLSVVVGAPGYGCTGPWGNALPGDIYAQTAIASGGVVASICDADLVSVLADLSTDVQDGARRFPLQATPVEDSVRVQIDDVRQDDGWRIVWRPPAIVLDTAPPPGAEIAVRYTVAAASP